MIPTFIACGGKGTRLGEQTKHKQKCAIEYAGKPLLEHTLDWLEKWGISKPGLIASYRPEDLDCLSHRVRNIIFEPKPMGTAGCLLSIAPLLERIKSDWFLYLLGDVFLDFDPTDFIKVSQAPFSNEDLLCFSVVRETDHPGDSSLVKNSSRLAHCGVFILHRNIMKWLPRNFPVDLTKDTFPSLNYPPLCYEVKCPPAFVRDTGTPEGQEKVREYLRAKHLVHAP